MKLSKSSLTLFAASLVVSASHADISQADGADQLCQVVERALASRPSFANAPQQAIEKSQRCVVEPSKSWRCELQYKNNCNNISRGSAENSDVIFSIALKAAEQCAIKSSRKNTEFNENNLSRRRILREARFRTKDVETFFVVSADTIQSLSPLKCESSEIIVRLEAK